MGSEVAYRDDEYLAATQTTSVDMVNMTALQQRLADVDEAILLVRRLHVREAELVRMYTTLSDNLAPQAPKALPTSAIKEYNTSGQRVSSPDGTTYIDHGVGVGASPWKVKDGLPFYQKVWFAPSCMAALGLGVLALVGYMVVSFLNWMSDLASGVSSWWAASGASIMGFIGLAIIVLIVLMLKGGGGGTFSGTFQGRWR